jgi:hypothetical protein
LESREWRRAIFTSSLFKLRPVVRNLKYFAIAIGVKAVTSGAVKHKTGKQTVVVSLVRMTEQITFDRLLSIIFQIIAS